MEILIDAAKHAGEIALRYWKSSPDIWDKPDGAGPVTQADLEIDAMLTNELLSAQPDYGWLSEETEDSSARLGADKIFIVDPIDGTRAFINGEKTFAHSLAVAQKGKVVAAVVFLPALGALYSAAATETAKLNGSEIVVSNSAPVGAQVLSNKVNLEPEYWPGGVPPVQRHFRSSLAYRLCLVADGQFDGMLTLRNTWEWDVAAGNLIVEKAGGRISDREGVEPVFNNPHPQVNGILAAGRELHADLKMRLSPKL